jgi:hypothetical protein
MLFSPPYGNAILTKGIVYAPPISDCCYANFKLQFIKKRANAALNKNGKL